MQNKSVKKVGVLLEKYKKNLRAPQGSVEGAFRQAVLETLGTELAEEQVRYTVLSRTISVSVAGPVKSEILLNKEVLFEKCKAAVGEHSTPCHIV